MLKQIADIRRLVSNRFAKSYARTVVLESFNLSANFDDAWPYTIALGRLPKRELVGSIERVVGYVNELEGFTRQNGLELRFDTRIAGGKQRVPTHVIVPGVDEAASAIGSEQRARLKRARARARALAEAFPSCEVDALARVIAKCDDGADLDFELLVQAALWFRDNDAAGLTPRQVPLEGFHAKWLDSAGRRKLIALLCGKDDLGLVGRPVQIDFAYLDPVYLGGGERRYDSHVLGDAFSLPYDPRNVVIVENKDTYLRFPQLNNAVCVFGNGREGAARVYRVPWVSEADRLFYWGDMDADGLEILNGYRASGLVVQSVLMDLDSYYRYERFGTSFAVGPRQLADRKKRQLDYLTVPERELYDLLVSPDCPGARRIEQERIPLDHALAAISFAIGQPAPASFPA